MDFVEIKDEEYEEDKTIKKIEYLEIKDEELTDIERFIVNKFNAKRIS